MNKEEIQKQIAIMDAYIPVYKIEEKLGMPKTTLQKVLKGERELPKKWLKVLEAYFVKKVEKAIPPKTPPVEPKNMSRIDKMVWEAEQEILNQNKK